MGQHTASKVRPVMVCGYASLLPVLVPVLGGWRRVACLGSCHKARLGRAAPTTARRRERRTSVSQASPRCRAPAGSRSRRTGRAARRCSPGLPSLGLEVTLPEVRLDGRRQRDDFLLHHSLNLPDVRLDCHSDSVLLDNVLLLRCVERRMVGVGGISILQLFSQHQ